MRVIATLAALALSACATTPSYQQPQRLQTLPQTLPSMKVFGQAVVSRPTRSNADMARDFMELSFQMESGRLLPVLTRFEQPITISVAGAAPRTLTADLTSLIARLRSEAKIDIRRAPAGTTGQIAIQAIPRAELQRYVPQAACFVVPRVSSWSEFKSNRRGKKLDWTTLSRRDQVAIFVPGDVSPQEARDCLHEEIGQALGPLNDLYRLSDSVFNDDNFHTVLTGFDMLILRVYYAPELANGMSRGQVMARLPAVLARLNPSGERSRAAPTGPTPRSWINAIETALGPNTTTLRRRVAAGEAVNIAASQGWTDTRMAFSLFALGRLSLANEADVALAAFLDAGQIYRASPETAIQEAHVNMQMAAFALSAGDAESALLLTNRSLDVVAKAQNAALLSTLLMVKAEALELLGRPSEARSVRLDSLGWARYGFGSDKEVRARMSEIAALSPKIQTVGDS